MEAKKEEGCYYTSGEKARLIFGMRQVPRTRRHRLLDGRAPSQISNHHFLVSSLRYFSFKPLHQAGSKRYSAKVPLAHILLNTKVLCQAWNLELGHLLP